MHHPLIEPKDLRKMPEEKVQELISELRKKRNMVLRTNINTAFFNTLTGAKYFASRREEQIKSTHYFCRVRHNQYNHSQNPTYTSGSAGDLTIASFRNDPKSYITTVGLYNSANELLAVAKLSKPVLKSSSREALIKVRLDF